MPRVATVGAGAANVPPLCGGFADINWRAYGGSSISPEINGIITDWRCCGGCTHGLGRASGSCSYLDRYRWSEFRAKIR